MWLYMFRHLKEREYHDIFVYKGKAKSLLSYSCFMRTPSFRSETQKIMGRVRRGRRVQRKVLWAVAGRLANVANKMKNANITNRDTRYSSSIWSELSVVLFGIDER